MSGITLDRIVAVQAAYIRCIDTGALEDWPGFFTTAASTRSPPPTTTSRASRPASSTPIPRAC